MQSRRAHKRNIHACAHHQGQVAKELNRVAEAVVVEHKDSSRRSALARATSESGFRAPRRATCPQASAPHIRRSHVRNRRASAAGSLCRPPLHGCPAPRRLQRPRALLRSVPDCAALTLRRTRPLQSPAARRSRTDRRLSASSMRSSFRNALPRLIAASAKCGRSVSARRCGFKQLLQSPEFAESSGAAGPGVSIVGRKRRGCFECRKRFCEATRVKQQLARIEMGDGERWLDVERLSIKSQSGFRLSALAEHIAAHAESFSEIRPTPQGLVDAGDRHLALSLPPRKACSGVERVRVGRRGPRRQVGLEHRERHPQERRLRGPFRARI